MFKLKTLDLKTKKDSVFYKPVFYILMACSVIAFFILAALSDGTSFKSLFFLDDGDSFMDHYNSVVYNRIDPFENRVIYPPVATATYRLFLQLIPNDVFNYIVSDPTVTAQSRDMKINQGFVFQFILFGLITLTCFLLAVYLCKKGAAKEKMFFAVLMCLSSPFLFMLERGNNIIIPLFFTMLFVCFHDSKNKIIRELSLIFFALAVAYKLYPIAFGVLLFRNKQYKELFRAGVYCVAFTVLPFFLFYDGVNSIKLLFGNLSFISDRRNDIVYMKSQLNFSQMPIYLAGILRIPVSDPDTVAKCFKIILSVMCVFSAFFTKQDWKSAMLCACILYGFQNTCATYLLIFFIVPIMMLLDSEHKNNIMSYVYLILMTMTLIPIALTDPNVGGWSRYLPTKISSLAVFAMVIIAFAETLVYVVQRLKKRIEQRNALNVVNCDIVDGGAEV